jgi:hypothetical protein
MVSSRIHDTQTICVIFDNTDFEDQEYMFANDLGITDDLKLENHIRLVATQVRTSAPYELSDAESPQMPIPPSPIPLLDIG